MDRMDGSSGAIAERPDDEAVLVERLLAGDEEAYARFFDGYFPGLFRFALSRLDHDEDLAQEMVQRSLVIAFEKLAGFRGESTLMSWLCGICRFVIGNHRRRRRRHREVALDDASGAPRPEVVALVDSEEGPLDDLERRERRARVHHALDKLPPHQAKVLEWKYLEGLPVREIADRLEMGEKAVESLLTRSRKAFRKGYARLAREDDDPRRSTR